MSSHEADDTEHADPLGLYLTVFFTLLALLVLTVLAYHIPFEKIHNGEFSFMNTVIALTIATIKALLVMLVFMHLRHSSRLTWVIAAAGFVWLSIMIAFTFADYLSRGSIPEGMQTPPSQISPDHLEH